jgi:cytochrome c
MRWAALAAMAVVAFAWGPDANRGKELVGRRCGGCHAVDGVKAAPPLRGVYGRAAGTDGRFPYSDALKGSHVVWDEATLDKWVADPESVVPGNDMAFRLDNAAERADIIAYLRTLR